MGFQIRPGSRGPSAFWEGKLLTSAYDPEKEARAWALRVAAEPGALVFVAGDPWGLCAQALVERGIRAVALMPGSASRALLPAGTEAWTPEDGTLENFLQSVFGTTGPDGVIWEVWPAFERHAAALALDWSRRFRDVFRTVQGSWLTQRRFGTRFWRNSIRNFVRWDQPAELVPGTRPIVIAASGPSLDDGMRILSEDRDLFDLWALPSSFEVLEQRGLSPDAGVATDGGYYAREHLQRLAGRPMPLLAALSSAPDPVLSARPCLFFSQGMLLEHRLLASLGRTFPEVPSQGTVAVTALRLALQATTGPVFIAGLDLSFRDVRGHASPHTVDRRLSTQYQRLDPQEGLWTRSLLEQATVWHEGVRTSPALLTYALWFRSRAQFSRSIHRIAPSPLRWETMTEVSWEQARRLWNRAGKKATWSSPVWPGLDERRNLVLKVLGKLKREVESAPTEAPWLIEAARTAVPEALAQDFKARRQGRSSNEVAGAFAAFLAELREAAG